MSRLRADRQFWLTLLLLVGAGLLLEYTATDLWVQDLFYNPTSKRWLVDQQAPLGRIFLQRTQSARLGDWVEPTHACVWAGAVAGKMAAQSPWALARGARARNRAVIGRYRKKYTNTFCPSEIRRYGGDVAYVKLCEPFPAADRPERRGGVSWQGTLAAGSL